VPVVRPCFRLSVKAEASKRGECGVLDEGSVACIHARFSKDITMFSIQEVVQERRERIKVDDEALGRDAPRVAREGNGVVDDDLEDDGTFLSQKYLWHRTVLKSSLEGPNGRRLP